ncbi:MAG: type II secretion system protein [Oscillospiraceae bacterium]|nr:type II secretion system protein [Oscillospiraceae bacterium]
MTSSRINTILKNRKNKNKKGFSLVELIVVLVIMAILAAALVPTLIGYINQTRQSNAKNEAAAAVSAAQTVVSSAYASPDKTYVSNTSGVANVVFTDFDGNTDPSGGLITSGDFIAAATKLSEVDKSSGTITKITVEGGVVTGLEYTAGNSQNVVYTVTDGKGTYTIS